MTSSDQSSTDVPPLQLAPGSSSTLRGISDNFAFHSSPESFIAARVAQWQKSDPTALDKRTPVRAKILNRNVVVVSSYHQIQSVLSFSSGNDSDDPPFVAASAYHELMNEFFPPPNVLLADGCPHRNMRTEWDHKMESFNQMALGATSSVTEVIRRFFASRSFGSSSSPIDLYEEMKTLAWEVLLGSFLSLSPHGGSAEKDLFDEIQRLHEVLLRGQFSLVPVSINAWVWQSPRSKGVRARKKLQELITERIHHLRGRESDADGDHFITAIGAKGDAKIEEIRDHVLMMTSSLAVKGLASLLTAFMLNLFLSEVFGVRLVEHMRAIAENGKAELRKHLRSCYFETERLSPPIVGIMRRTTRDMVLEGDDDEPSTLLPRGWDVWLYFVGAGRDPTVFGDACMTFDPGRFLNDEVPEPLGFGVGPKSCLGKGFLRDVVLMVAEHCLTNDLSIEGSVSKQGLKGWLGWDAATPEQWAADMKQLPTQHPAKPVMVRFVQH